MYSYRIKQTAFKPSKRVRQSSSCCVEQAVKSGSTLWEKKTTSVGEFVSEYPWLFTVSAEQIFIYAAAGEMYLDTIIVFYRDTSEQTPHTGDI